MLPVLLTGAVISLIARIVEMGRNRKFLQVSFALILAVSAGGVVAWSSEGWSTAMGQLYSSNDQLQLLIRKTLSAGEPYSEVVDGMKRIGFSFHSGLRAIDENELKSQSVRAGDEGCWLQRAEGPHAGVKFVADAYCEREVEFLAFLFLTYTGRPHAWLGFDRRKRLVDIHSRIEWTGL